ncbi:autotransporter outer membrane beta-barrel domain-containing protein [Campylobacter molothri]|uniref:autotransporter outer membrane beta-barrel domain-containing protein n=1 Tax=Campylobacter molothri TaxID=1032242 RepID=UPI00301D6537|nr:autotransporter outer membrane beta-barrel domain-containing protein [Campylobacter sp. RM10534]
MGIWGSNQGTLTIDNFNNSGTIKADNGNGILFEGNVHMETFKNSGMIQANKAIELKGGTIQNFTNDSSGTIQGNEVGIVINSHINTFENKGLINSPGNGRYNNGIWISSGANIETFTNSGTISGGNGIRAQGGTIKTLINSGTIVSSGKELTGAGIKLESGGTIDNIINTGTIQSNSYGIAVSHGSFGTLTIKEGGVVYGEKAGIIVGQWQTLGDLYIDGKNKEKDTTVSGIYSNEDGIFLEKYSQTKKIELKNGGIIKGLDNGIKLGQGASLSGEMILSGEGSRVEGGSGAGVSNVSGTISGSIKVENGATVTSSSGQAISNSGSGSIIGGITISGENTKLEGNIINTDNASIGSDIKIENGANVEGGIVNQGNGSISGSITVGKGSKLDSIVNTSTSDTGISGSITNNSDNKLEISNGEGATIGGGIVNSGNGTIHINNQGSIGKNESGSNITNNGNIVVEDWVVSTGDDGKLEGIVVGGDGADKVTIDNVTIDQGGLDLGELEDISNIVSGVKPGQVGNIGINGSGEISLGFDPITGKLSTDFNLNASIAGATFRSLINTTSRRASFIDSVMGNSMQHFAFAKPNTSIAMQEKGNLYANASDYIKNDFNNGSYGYNKEHSLFILPYTSSQNVELSLNEESKGHTRGTIIGYSTLKDSGIYGVYVGYEDTKMSSTYFDINNRSYYTGLKYFNTLFTTSKGQEVYLKAQGKTAFIKNKLSKKIGKSEAEASPNSYAYGMSGDLGMNFNHGDNIFSPEAGLVYEGGYTEAFSMINTKGQATVMGGERTYANYLNLLSTRTSFTWFRDWLPNLKTSMTLGAKFNINPQVKAKARFGQVKVKDEFYLPRVQRYVTTSMIVPLNNVFYFSLNYNGMFDSKGDTHTGFAQFNYIW